MLKGLLLLTAYNYSSDFKIIKIGLAALTGVAQWLGIVQQGKRLLVHSQSGHVTGWQVWSLVWAHMGGDGCFFLISMFLSLPYPHSKNK